MMHLPAARGGTACAATSTPHLADKRRSPMAFQDILFEQRGSVAIVTLNRPSKLNAFTNVMIDEAIQVIEKAGLDDGVRCLVIRGAGRAFCSGDDLSGMGEFPRPVPPGKSSLDYYQFRLVKSLRDLLKPAIASIHGYCHGMGEDTAMACDLRLTAEGTRFGEPRILRGMHITTGATYLLPRMVGLPRALELLMLGKTIDAQEALRIGLVHRVVPADDLEAATMELAERLASGPTKAYGLLKQQVYAEYDVDIDSALRDMEYHRCNEIEDREEGVKAFLEKREPKFTGR
jgi:2-(1,2-epoxy-1,2-dihydrophenyl)acetyl-CoA isomerase